MLKEPAWTPAEADAELERWRIPLVYGTILIVGVALVLYWFPG